MLKVTKVDIKKLEFTYKAGADLMLMRALSHWSRLGSSKTEPPKKTAERKQIEQELI